MNNTIIALGYDLSTTGLTVLGLAENGDTPIDCLSMEGATSWHGGAAFDLSFVPVLFEKALNRFIGAGFEFAREGCISGSVRQHDMVLTDERHSPLIPALSWQCNRADQETELLRKLGIEKVVGKIEPRFIFPKLLWTLRQDPALFDAIKRVMTTGDWIALHLTGKARLSTSDALSNGLLDQKTRAFAHDVFAKTNIPANWFPEVVKSDTPVGKVTNQVLSAAWAPVANLLSGWQCIASLGDNHAGAVGCGLIDTNTIIISLGTSGTVVRRVDRTLPLMHDRVAQFEYYDDRLLLAMLADCGAWWRKFVEEFGQGKSDKELDHLADEATCFIPIRDEAVCVCEHFKGAALGVQAASVQLALVASLMDRFKDVDSAITNFKHTIDRVVLTGGLSRSPLIRRTFRRHLLEHGIKDVFVGSLEGPAAEQAAARGALINALVGGSVYPDLSAAALVLCPLTKLK